MTPLISPVQALILGAVEGLTEFLPVSSTGHLILTSSMLGIPYEDEGVKAFEIVIQAGALLAVAGYYFERLKAMTLGAAGRNPPGLRLLHQLFIGFLPAAVIGLLAEKQIKLLFNGWELFGEKAPWPVVFALAVGGVAMIAAEVWRARRVKDPSSPGWGTLEFGDLTLRAAFIVGCAQCLAMWPGTSRSMTTIVAALLLGYTPRAAAEFSFLLALPTLGAATAHDLLKDGGAILHASGWFGLLIGFGVSAVVAWFAVGGFLTWLKKHGMIPFGIYRIIASIVVAMMFLKMF